MFLLAALLLLIPIVATLEENIDSIYADGPYYIPQERVDKWAQQITSQLEAYERRALDRERLIESLHVPPMHRDGTALVDEVAQKIASVVASRAAAAVGIAKMAEKLADSATEASKIPLPGTTFNPSVELDKYKSWRLDDRDNSEWSKNHSCRGYLPMHLDNSTQFSAKITRLVSSAHVPVETFDCDNEVLSELNRTEALDVEFRKNYAKDATFSWQYFCSARGFLRHYPGAAWDSMAGAYQGEENDLYDCRMRAWYIEATGAPRDILVLLDSTGSMSNLTQLIAHELTRELFTALTDDDHVNVIRFQRMSFSAVPCFENVLVPANHVNVAALLYDQIEYRPRNYTSIPAVLRNAVQLLNESRQRTKTPPACQQAIVLLTDLVPENYTALMRELDPEGSIRVFVFLLGVGKMLLDHAENLACESDGYFAQLQVAEDASEQARKILRVLERPAVLHRQEHQSSLPRSPPVWGDLYAHVQDTRFAIHRWRLKERAEQKDRYMRLRRDKVGFLSPEQRQHDYEMNEYRTTRGRYSEEEDPDTRYQLMVSVSVPAYDPVKLENVTIKLMEEMQRDSTREERVARLLGVAGVDLPLDDLRLRLPYHKLGPGGSLILLDHRGNVILHDDLRPVVDGNILKNGYRTVDLLDVELLDGDMPPRNYSPELVQFREAIMSTENGVLDLSGLVPYDGRRRAMAGQRRYFWRRVKGTGYTAVISLPVRPPGDAHAASRAPPPERVLMRAAASDAHRSLNDTEFTIQPDWLYCRYTERHFSRREDELLHFLQRISEEPDFSFQQLHYSIRHLPPGLLDTPYFCDEELIARLAWEARTTVWFSSVEDDESQSAECALGSSTIFFATVGGLTRWRHRVVPGDGPAALLTGNSGVARASAEPWYRRAAAAGPSTLILHAGVAAHAPAGWLTAARALRHLGVTGFHFKMAHLGGLLTGVTAPLCEGSAADCELTCSSEEWHCILIDEAGWVLAGTPALYTGHAQHLTSAYPAIMKHLLEASVFQKRWLYDYQGTCFTPTKYGFDAAPRIWPLFQVLFSWSWLADTIRCFVLQLHHTIEALMMLAYVGKADAETEAEEQKRKVRVRKDFNRQQWERLYNESVLINKTLPATCDRRRAIYSLRADAATRLAHQSVSCGNWSMVAALVPRTNMMLLALYTLCPYTELKEPLDDPMDNLEVPLKTPPELQDASMEVRLACERHMKSAKLLARGPAATCYAHSREQEWEFRKCDLREADKDSTASFKLTTYFYLFCTSIAVLFF